MCYMKRQVFCRKSAERSEERKKQEFLNYCPAKNGNLKLRAEYIFFLNYQGFWVFLTNQSTFFFFCQNCGTFFFSPKKPCPPLDIKWNAPKMETTAHATTSTVHYQMLFRGHRQKQSTLTKKSSRKIVDCGRTEQDRTKILSDSERAFLSGSVW